jgi:hypothetical protein
MRRTWAGFALKFLKTGVLPGVVAIALSLPAHATSLFINPTFDATITGDPNALAIEGAINNAIANLEAAFSDPIEVDIKFQEGSGLGSSSTFFLGGVSYALYCADLVADKKSANDTTAMNVLAPGGVCPTNNPVTGDSTINVKTANLRAVGIATPGHGSGAGLDGTITLNTALTFPGSPGSSLTYSLIVVAEHEIDEVLGLGSTLPGGNGPNVGAATLGDPFPEDLFRFTGGSRTLSSGSCGSLPTAFFSIDNNATQLAQFNNACNGGDFGDWASSGSAQVQDAFATPGATPALGNEITALDVIGFDAVSAPEPGTYLLVGTGLLAAVLLKRRAGSLPR